MTEEKKELYKMMKARIDLSRQQQNDPIIEEENEEDAEETEQLQAAEASDDSVYNVSSEVNSAAVEE